MSEHYNSAVTVTASAPTRIDLAGGTIDIWPLYLFHPGAQTLNAALTIRTFARLDRRDDDAVVLVSEDLGVTSPPLAFDALPAETTLPLLARLAHAFGARGLTLTTSSDSPAGAGIAGSSALAIAVTAALTAWTGHGLDGAGLLEVAQNVEAQVIRVPTGLQDYRPALYGGIAAVELGPFGARRQGLPVTAAALSARLVLCYTGAPRQSGINNWDITKRRIDGDPTVTAAFDGIVDATRRHARRPRGRRLGPGRRLPRRGVGHPQAPGAGRHDAGHRRPARPGPRGRGLGRQGLRRRRRRLPVRAGTTRARRRRSRGLARRRARGCSTPRSTRQDCR